SARPPLDTCSTAYYKNHSHRSSHASPLRSFAGRFSFSRFLRQHSRHKVRARAMRPQAVTVLKTQASARRSGRVRGMPFKLTRHTELSLLTERSLVTSNVPTSVLRFRAVQPSLASSSPLAVYQTQPETAVPMIRRSVS